MLFLGFPEAKDEARLYPALASDGAGLYPALAQAEPGFIQPQHHCMAGAGTWGCLGVPGVGVRGAGRGMGRADGKDFKTLHPSSVSTVCVCL